MIFNVIVLLTAPQTAHSSAIYRAHIYTEIKILLLLLTIFIPFVICRVNYTKFRP